MSAAQARSLITSRSSIGRGASRSLTLSTKCSPDLPESRLCSPGDVCTAMRSSSTGNVSQLLADPRGRSRQAILCLGVLREGAGIVISSLCEILLRLNHFEHGIDSELAPLLAELQALVRKLDASSGQTCLIQSRTSSLVGVHDLLRYVILQSRVQQLLVPKLGVGCFRA